MSWKKWLEAVSGVGDTLAKVNPRRETSPKRNKKKKSGKRETEI